MATARHQDAIALLKADHRKVEALFAKYEKARGNKSALAKQICLELTVHTIIEEEILYPAARDAVEDDILDEAYVEHDGAKLMISELEAGAPGDDFYDAKVKVLSEEIKHHVKEEEQRDGLFAQLKASDADLMALGEQLKTRKLELTEEIKKGGLPPPVTRTLKGGKLRRGGLPA